LNASQQGKRPIFQGHRGSLTSPEVLVFAGSEA
jgi:hypothetical protein